MLFQMIIRRRKTVWSDLWEVRQARLSQSSQGVDLTTKRKGRSKAKFSSDDEARDDEQAARKKGKSKKKTVVVPKSVASHGSDDTDEVTSDHEKELNKVRFFKS